MRLFLTLFLLLYLPLAHSKTVVSYKYNKASSAVQKTITLKELEQAYKILRSSTYNPPNRKDFLDSYIRFRLGAEVALHNKKLVSSPKIEDMVTHSSLKEEFRQELYMTFAELNLRSQMKRLEREASSLSESKIKAFYNKNPEFNIFYISVNHPINPKKTQIKEASDRAQKIHAQVKSSKKPFLELVALYSDDKVNGSLAINRSYGQIPPQAYKVVRKMKAGQVSTPVRIDTGFVIIKLNKKVPFYEADEAVLKANYFNEKRTALFNKLFDGLRKDFTVSQPGASLFLKN